MQYGEGGSYSVTMDGPFGNTSSATRLRSISALKNAWKGGESPYSQTIEVDGFSVKSKIDIQLTVDQMETFRDQVIAFTVVNNKGVIALYAIGDKPANDCVFQATITEIVTDNDVIIGNTVSTVQNRADYNQNDSTKADFILNRPIEAIQKTQSTADEALQIAKNALSTNGGTMTGNIDMGKRKITNVADPTADGDAVNKAFVEKRNTKEVSVTLLASGWSAAAPYTQSVAVEGLTDKLRAKVYPAWPEDAEAELALRDETVKVSSCRRSGSTMTFRCLEEKPELDIPVTVEVYV